jgi:hypothetical protein
MFGSNLRACSASGRFAALLLALPFVLAASPAGVDTSKLAGRFGFDWLHPKSKCTRIDAPLLKKFASAACSEHPSSEAFTDLGERFHRCKVSDAEEWMIFSTKKACESEWATMDANGE